MFLYSFFICVLTFKCQFNHSILVCTIMTILRSKIALYPFVDNFIMKLRAVENEQCCGQEFRAYSISFRIGSVVQNSRYFFTDDCSLTNLLAETTVPSIGNQKRRRRWRTTFAAMDLSFLLASWRSTLPSLGRVPARS